MRVPNCPHGPNCSECRKDDRGVQFPGPIHVPGECNCDQKASKWELGAPHQKWCKANPWKETR